MNDVRNPPADRPHIAYGSLDAYRDAIGECLAGAEIYARLGATYTQISDDAGLDHAVRCLVAMTRQSLGMLGDLKAMKAAQAERRAQAPRTGIAEVRR